MFFIIFIYFLAEDPKKPEPPEYAKVAKMLVQKCLNFISSKDENRQILALEILNEGVLILSDWEDDVLPLVHQIWSPLIQRFKGTNYTIMRYSFSLFRSLAIVSKDFIRMRTIK